MTAWDELVGQEQVASLLQAASEGIGMTHAWLITGPPGSGRSNAAKLFAAALVHGNTADLNSSSWVHPDIDCVSTEHVTISIDEVRQLIELAQRTPTSGKHRVIVVEDADRMLERTANVLLKSIEEPPEKTVWILCAPSPQDVIATIRSRCRTLTLRVPPPESVAQLLISRDGVPPDTARFAAAASGSHIGIARRLATDTAMQSRRHHILELVGSIKSAGSAVDAASEIIELAKAENSAASEARSAQERAALLRSYGVEGEKKLPPYVQSELRKLEKDQKRRTTRELRDTYDWALITITTLYRDALMSQLRTGKHVMNTDAIPLVERLGHEHSPEDLLQKISAISTARKRLTMNVAPQLALEAMASALI